MNEQKPLGKALDLWLRASGRRSANTRTGQALQPALTAGLLVLSAITVGVLSLWIAPGSFGPEMFQSYFTVPLLVVLNVLPVLWLAALCWVLTNQAWVGVLLSGGVTLTLTIINEIKLALRSTPFLWEDLSLAGEAGNMAGHYTIELSGEAWTSIWVWLALAAASLLLGGWKLPDWKSHWKARAKGAAGLLLAALVLWPLVYQNAAVYRKTANEALINIWNDTQVYQSKGFLYPFLYSAKAARDDPPAGYSPEKARQILAEYEGEDIPEEERVSVLGIMLEAYCDLTEFEQLAFAEPAYEAFHALQNRSWSGTLVTNCFAGGTIDTERCFLTGYADLGSFRSPTQSYAWYFRQQGYWVEGGHPGYSWFYNRTNVNENLGFFQYLFSENYYSDLIDPQVAPYHSDGIFLPHLGERMSILVQEAPQFSFNVTYQNHGPYSGKGTTWEDYMPRKCRWSEETQNILNNYLDGIRRTGEHLSELVRQLDRLEEPVVLVVFGDHKPWLGDGNSVYKEVGIELDLGTEEGFFNYYSTPYLIWGNHAAKLALHERFVGQGPAISPCFLMSELFEQCGWTGSSFLQFSQEVKEAVPVFTSSDRYLESGSFWGDLTEEQQELVQKFDWVQYYLRKTPLQSLMW
ncbi:MAG: LTA synthase family protein [Oscillospiraceae bacterium]|nr:LTA synthase family protein [Oscillospiraceae bacterium]